MRSLLWQFDGSPSWHGFTDDSAWNGFTNVWITPQTMEQLIAWLLEQEDDTSGETIADLRVIPLDERGLYSLANGFATLESSNPPTLRWNTPQAKSKILDALIAAESVLAEQWQNYGGGIETIYFNPLMQIRIAISLLKHS